METKKRVTKLSLEDIPKVGSPFRTTVIKQLTELDIYKEEIKKNAVLGFTTEELKAIVEKYKHQRGLFNEDIQNEINKKGWLTKPSTIKQYIQKGQLPMSKERRKIKGGAVSLYPLDFIHHVNFVRFFLNTGREICENILNLLTPTFSSQTISDLSFADSMDGGEEIYDDFGGGISRIIDLSVDMIWECSYNINVFKTVLKDSVDVLNDKYVLGFENRKEIFEKFKGILNISKDVDNNFSNTLRNRINKYIIELFEIKEALENSSGRLARLKDEMSRATWTNIPHGQ